MMPKKCNRLAEVARRITPEARPVRAGQTRGPVVHTLLMRPASGLAWRNHSRDGVS
jgi:hypothetical protein